MQEVTLSTVATYAQVSQATVSRVMSGARPVGAEVEARVRAAALELGYTGNGIARALRKKRTDTVGMVVPSILNPFFTMLVDGMENALYAEGKQLFLCDSRDDPATEAKHLRSLMERQVDGIVISACHVTKSVPAIVAAARSHSLVQLDRFVEYAGADWVGINDVAAIELMLAHLYSGGARSAGFITSELTNSSTANRLSGFRSQASKLGFRVRDEWVVLGDYSVESGEVAAEAILRTAERPDVIICASDLIAFGVLRACRRNGLKVPDDIKVTGFDNIVFSEHVMPPLTSIEQPIALIADEALRLLNRKTTSNIDFKLPGSIISLTPKLIVRESSS